MTRKEEIIWMTGMVVLCLLALVGLFHVLPWIWNAVDQFHVTENEIREILCEEDGGYWKDWLGVEGECMPDSTVFIELTF